MKRSTSLSMVDGSGLGAVVAPNVSGADSDAKLISVWVSTKASPDTRAAYTSGAARFVAFLAGKLFQLVSVGDLQAFADGLTGADSSRASSPSV
jgi:hypothetical protein